MSPPSLGKYLPKRLGGGTLMDGPGICCWQLFELLFPHRLLRSLEGPSRDLEPRIKEIDKKLYQKGSVKKVKNHITTRKLFFSRYEGKNNVNIGFLIDTESIHKIIFLNL